MADLTEKQVLQQWTEYVENIRKSTALLNGETDEQKKRRIKELEADPELWFKYYFPKYSYAEPADFHKAATKRVLNNLEWYEVRAWSRELAKSTRTMMEMLYLLLTKKKRYLLLISNTEDNAERLLAPYRANLEGNQRIINDYGEQKLPGSWTGTEFTTRTGAGFRALGWGQSPRGTRNEEIRPDIILFDDIDTDEECRNSETIKVKWDWIEKAAIPTRSISVQTTIIFCGNIIAEDCSITRAAKVAKKMDIVNIRDEYGKSTWPQKNTEEMIDAVLSTVTYSTQQQEYFNNPIREGQTFEQMKWGKCPPISSLPFVVVYADPSTSNKDRPSIKSKNANSSKAIVLVGSKDGHTYYVYKAWVKHTGSSKFIDALFAFKQHVIQHGAKADYTFIENNTLQDSYYEQVFKPLISQRNEQLGNILGVLPDDRKKPDKFIRIESNLEPLNSHGKLILNEDEKDDPDMKVLETQFKSCSPNSKTMDGPDAVEGAYVQIRDRIKVSDDKTKGVKTFARQPNKNRV